MKWQVINIKILSIRRLTDSVRRKTWSATEGRRPTSISNNQPNWPNGVRDINPKDSHSHAIMFFPEPKAHRLCQEKDLVSDRRSQANCDIEQSLNYKILQGKKILNLLIWFFHSLVPSSFFSFFFFSSSFFLLLLSLLNFN